MHRRAAGDVFQRKALSRSFPARCEDSQRGMKRERGGLDRGISKRDKSFSISLYKSVLSLSSVCPHFVRSPPLATNPHGCWVSSVCPHWRSVLADQQPVNVVNGRGWPSSGGPLGQGDHVRTLAQLVDMVCPPVHHGPAVCQVSGVVVGGRYAVAFDV